MNYESFNGKYYEYIDEFIRDYCMEDINILIPVIVALVSGGLVKLLDIIGSRKKTKAEVESLQAERDTKQAEKEAKQDEAVAHTYGHIATATEQLIATAQKNIEIYEKTLSKAAEREESLEARILKLENQVEELLKNSGTKDKEISQLRQENESLRASVSKLESEIEGRDNIIEALRERIDELERKLGTMRTDVDGMNGAGGC